MEELKQENIEELEPSDSDTITVGQFILDLLKTVAIAVIFSLLIGLCVKPTLVVGQSMYPTLHDRDYLLLNRLAYKAEEPQKGDIVVFHTNLQGEKILIKRVVATEGDHVRVANGKVYVNGDVLNEEYINHEEPLTFGDVDAVVPEGHVFAMGDNRNHSLDSRFTEIGFVNTDEIMGKVFIRLFPDSHTFNQKEKGDNKNE